MSCFIDDGYTARKAVEARPGLHPAVTAEYRPALGGKRNEYAQKFQGDPAKQTAWENDLLARHVVRLDGDPLDAGKADRLVPALRTDLLNLVLGYAGADEAADAKNSCGGAG